MDAFDLGSADASDRLLVPARLYGRDAERTVLLDGFKRCADGASVFCLLDGEEGSGSRDSSRNSICPSLSVRDSS